MLLYFYIYKNPRELYTVFVLNYLRSNIELLEVRMRIILLDEEV